MSPRVRSCEYISRWGRCKQPAKPTGSFCSTHAHWLTNDIEPDLYYEEKVVRGLVTPTHDAFTDEENRTLLGGRIHGDGRRLDQWVVDDPLEWSE